MKKFTKLCLGLASAVGLATVLKKHQDEQFKQIVAKSLKEAKTLVHNETVTGTWIDMTPVWSQEVASYALVGGIMTKDNTYDFIAHYKTSEILSFKKQNR